ncbi:MULTISPECIES: SLC13 family permease [unclassified Arenimonas]|uniref:SLC13 family permease n=1 Tax=unclassified Arenimonas TaxID=2641713 RepID=UPI0008697DBE|nr:MULTISPECIES: SLC13 family permease [unclassified Arenimonas]ODS64532.1 MAG: potassium transporter TrkA [Arenimonas sp. SCN 70-307]
MDTSLALTRDMMLVLGLVGFTVVMFMIERIRADATALVVLVVLGLTGLVPANQLFDGFSGNAVIAVIATMILGAGLDRTGALNRLAVWLLRLSKGMEERLIVLTSAMAGLMSGFMQNPSVMALFLPVASRLSGRTGISLSRLLLPVAAAIVMGGGLTMIGNSPLMLLNDLLVAANRNLPSGVATLQPLEMFAPLPIGIALLLAGLGYYRWLGGKLFARGEDKGVAPGRTQSYFARAYGIEGDVYELTVTAESPLVGMSVGEAEAQREAPLYLALLSGNEARLAPPADQMIWVGSVLGVMGPREAIQDYAQKNLLRMSARLRHFADLFNPSRSGISEAVIPPTSSFIGKAQANLQLRKRFGISLLAINRDNQVWREDIRKMPIKAGDMLVFHSIWTDLAQASESRDFVVVTDYPKGEQRPQKLWWALAVFVGAMALALSTLVPVPIALMAGAAAMMLAGVLNMDEAYAAVNWKTVFLMACLIPLGWAMDSTGAAAWIAQQVLERIGEDVPIWVIEAAVGLLATAFALVIGNVGATVVMVPMAINVALAAGGNPLAFALIVALSASNNFLSVSNPVLAMVTGPAGYGPRDLWRTGAPLTLVYLALVLLIVNLMF